MRIEDLTKFEEECPTIVVFNTYMDIRVPLTKKWKKIIDKREDKPNTYHNNLINYISEQIELSGFNMKSIGNLLTPKSLLKKSANEWFGNNHELSLKSDKIKREHARELKRIFQILLNHQALEVLGTVNVIVDEVCGEGTWLKYRERVEKHRISREVQEVEKLRKLEELEEERSRDFYKKLEKWKSGELDFLHACSLTSYDKPNVWMRIKGGIIETSKEIKIGIEEARRMWQVVSLLHQGGQFRHGLVEDVDGNRWKINRYENDMLTAGCHRIAYSEMESIAKQLGWV